MKTVFVAMSGGVDSSVAAALLKQQGFNVIGVYFKPWSPAKDVSYCDWKQEQRDAMRVAAKLNIQFVTWDFSKEYGNKVTKYMIDEYRHGLTPNPDVMCNKEIKFGLFLKTALAKGADFIATGHYVRKKGDKLLKGKDKNKDQSYFLWTLTQKQLKYCLFPIGGYTKPEVRKIAKRFGLLNWDKKDSQGVCFVGQLNVKDFLKKYIKTKTGEIILKDTGKIIGTHDGVYYYTIGQRHGLDIGIGSGPYFVCKKDIKKNIIYVTRDINQLNDKECNLINLSFINSTIKFPFDADVKIRYRTIGYPAKIVRVGSLKKIIFKKPAKAISAGQSAVFYRGEELLGGGIISK